MKRLIILLLAGLLCIAGAAAEDTELLFRAIACMDKTGDVLDFAQRASVISGARLKENEGVYSGKIRLGKASYTLIVQGNGDGSISVIFDAKDTASKWSTIGAIAKRFDSAMTELFEVPVVDVLRGGDKPARPAPRITTGGLNLQRVSELKRELYVGWQNRRGTIFADLTGSRGYRECAFRLQLKFGGDSPFLQMLEEAEAPEESPDDWPDEEPEDLDEPEDEAEDEDWSDDEEEEDADEEPEDEAFEDEDFGDEDWDDADWEEPYEDEDEGDDGDNDGGFFDGAEGEAV